MPQTFTSSAAASEVPVKRIHAGQNAHLVVASAGGTTYTAAVANVFRMCKIPTNSRITGVDARLPVSSTTATYYVAVDGNTLGTSATVTSPIEGVNVVSPTLTTTASHSAGFVYADIVVTPGTSTATGVAVLHITYEAL